MIREIKEIWADPAWRSYLIYCWSIAGVLLLVVVIKLIYVLRSI
jgi:hypothetical protein